MAKPRMAKELQRAKQSHRQSPGRVGTLVVPGSLNEPGTTSTVEVSSFRHVPDGSIFLPTRIGCRNHCWQWQDEQWSEAGPGPVTVLPIQPVERRCDACFGAGRLIAWLA